jgi:serine/threonine protein kinase
MNRVDVRSSDDVKLRFIKKLGKGNFGEVWIADYTYMGKTLKDIAVKMMKLKDGDYDENKQIFTAEANIIKKLNNPNYTTTIYDAFIVENETDSLGFIIMDKLDSTYLTKIADNVKQYNGETWFKTIKNVIIQLLEDIQYIHKKGIIHSDIKPENILYNPRTKRFVLSDFGFSCIQKCVHTSGTPEYADPQLFLNMKTYNDKESDLYAIGCVIYDLFIKSNRYNMTNKLFVNKAFIVEAYDIIFDESMKSLSSFLSTKHITPVQSKGLYTMLYSMLSPFKHHKSASAYLKEIDAL